MTKPKTVHLYPVAGVHALPWPAQEWDATPEEWADIRQYIPCPFTDVAPEAPTRPAEPVPDTD